VEDGVSCAWRPLDRRVTHRVATAREVVAHWRKSKASIA
jgi:hypothetical protein